MPIVERTPRACFDVFTNHVSRLVAATITDRYPILSIPTETKLKLSFRSGSEVAAPIETARHGRLFFYLGQALEAVPEDDGFRLQTRQYWYRIQEDSTYQSDALIRWEYDATTGRDRHARHHTQIASEVEFGDGTLNLNKAHLPTGWVTFEEVIRFLIHDLGVVPPCGDVWPEKLEESERKFYEEFSSKGYRNE